MEIEELKQYIQERLLEQPGMELREGEGKSFFYKGVGEAHRVVRIPPRKKCVVVQLASFFPIGEERDWEEFYGKYVKPRMKELD